MSYVMNVDYISSEDRGSTQTEWLESRHTYSFGHYHNLKRINFGTLRVFNDDLIKPARGFDTHSHENMEIITIVLEGSLEHKDSKGNQGILRPGDVQRMTAGTGIHHSEKNPSQDQTLHLLQIWIYPSERDLSPSYEQKNFSAETFHNTFKQIVSSKPSESSVFIHQDATFFLGEFEEGQIITHVPRSRKHGDYIFVIDGLIQIGDLTLKKGDSAQVTQIDSLEIKTLSKAKVLLIEVNVVTQLA